MRIKTKNLSKDDKFVLKSARAAREADNFTVVLTGRTACGVRESREPCSAEYGVPFRLLPHTSPRGRPVLCIVKIEDQ
ncbi:jg23901 [Pararge aegeria aegeria]|uniref:Jg23901 protein n=1 Tax=Pararge aegeria aegeria TaxID=348720 RepID=A0A8S4S403_9NEOP|nr:jg23901 [Pararge aegeria aegeria]